MVNTGCDGPVQDARSATSAALLDQASSRSDLLLRGGPKGLLIVTAHIGRPLVDNERIAAIEPAGVAASADSPAIDLEARYVWPTLIDMHAHLDKGHIVTRT